MKWSSKTDYGGLLTVDSQKVDWIEIQWDLILIYNKKCGIELCEEIIFTNLW